MTSYYHEGMHPDDCEPYFTCPFCNKDVYHVEDPNQEDDPEACPHCHATWNQVMEKCHEDDPHPPEDATEDEINYYYQQYYGFGN